MPALETAGRPRRVHSKKEEHNCGVVGTHSEKEKWRERALERRRPTSPTKIRLGPTWLLVTVFPRMGKTWGLQQARAAQPGQKARRMRLQPRCARRKRGQEPTWKQEMLRQHKAHHEPGR
jgi:hypothetical protein